MLSSYPREVLSELPWQNFHLSPATSRQSASVVRLMPIFVGADVGGTIVVRFVSQVVNIRLKVVCGLSHVSASVEALFPVSGHYQLTVTTSKTCRLVSLSLRVSVRARKVNGPAIMFNSVFSFYGFLFGLMILQRVFRSARLHQFFHLSRSYVVTPHRLYRNFQDGCPGVIIVVRGPSMRVLIPLLM